MVNETDQMVIGSCKEKVFRIESNLLNRAFVISRKTVNQSTGFLKWVNFHFYFKSFELPQTSNWFLPQSYRRKHIWNPGRRRQRNWISENFYRKFMSIKKMFYSGIFPGQCVRNISHISIHHAHQWAIGHNEDGFTIRRKFHSSPFKIHVFIANLECIEWALLQKFELKSFCIFIVPCQKSAGHTTWWHHC